MTELLMIYSAFSLTALAPHGKWIPQFMPLRDHDILWKTIGFGGLGTFQTRWLVQWLHSERHKESKFPLAFWWLSVAGALLELLYFLRQQDPVGVAGYLISFVPYTRNLTLVYRKRRQEHSDVNRSRTATAHPVAHDEKATEATEIAE